MIKTINGNIFNSNANFIVCEMNCQGIIDDNMIVISEEFPHVEKEYMKYIRYCKKNHVEILGSVQYVPTEIWALNMVDTMKNNNIIDYDTNYQYIVNMFCKNMSDEGIKRNSNAVKESMSKIFNNAEMIGATVAVPYSIGNFVHDIANKYHVDVEIWR